MSDLKILAHKDGLALVYGLLLYSGAMCPCGSATRKTSKRWARCKKCGARIERKPYPERAALTGETP